jgi:hypothetical protein
MNILFTKTGPRDPAIQFFFMEKDNSDYRAFAEGTYFLPVIPVVGDCVNFIEVCSIGDFPWATSYSAIPCGMFKVTGRNFWVDEKLYISLTLVRV